MTFSYIRTLITSTRRFISFITFYFFISRALFSTTATFLSMNTNRWINKLISGFKNSVFSYFFGNCSRIFANCSSNIYFFRTILNSSLNNFFSSKDKSLLSWICFDIIIYLAFIVETPM